MKKLTRIAAALTAAAAMSLPLAAQAQQKLTVYTALQNELLKPYEAAFKKAYPEVQIDWLREPTGILQARLLAEKDNPRADIILGVPIMSLVTLDQAGLIERYMPKGADKLKPHMVDKNNPPIWSGMDMYVSLICFNTIEAEKRKLPKPTKWTDLINPIYKGQITMPNPAASQTGFLNMMSWIHSMGEDKAWQFMDKLHENAAMYTNSSSTPCKFASGGEYTIGFSTDITAPLMKTKGAPIDLIVPDDKVGWEIEGSSIVKGAKNMEAAKKLMDWTATREANVEFNKFMAIVAYPGVSNLPQNYPGNTEAKMANFDVSWAIKNRARLISEWAKRYDSKSEPKPKPK